MLQNNHNNWHCVQQCSVYLWQAYLWIAGSLPGNNARLLGHHHNASRKIQAKPSAYRCLGMVLVFLKCVHAKSLAFDMDSVHEVG